MNGREWRAVPLETVRAWLEDEAERTSLRAVAERVGLGRTTLQKFIAAETNPHPRVRRAFTLLYLGAASSAVDSALDALTAGLPDDAKPRARVAVTELLVRLHQAEGTPPPVWAGGALWSGT